MDDKTIQQLNAINRRFYDTTASEFDQTRGTAWPGWERLKPYVSGVHSVLDVGCGNGRFGLFLNEVVAQPIAYHGLDNNAALLGFAADALARANKLHIELSQHDIITQPLKQCCYDLVVLFGVVHHVPGAAQRRALMAQLAAGVAEGGLLVFAAWRFYEYERFRERLTPWPDELAAQVEAHDYLLDWRRGERALRYCHYVDDTEQAALIRASGLQHIETYRADGQTGDANCYSVLRKG